MKKYTLCSGGNYFDFVAPSQELALAEAKRLYPFANFQLYQTSDDLKLGVNPIHYIYS